MPVDSFARDLAAAALQKQGGGGGGGTGDMEKKVYDPTGAVEDKGGIPAYVSGVAKPLTVTLTETSAGSGKYTADKTYDDIKAAYDNHVPIQALVLNGASGDAVLPMMNAEVSGDGAGFTFGYTQLQNDAQTAAMRSIHYLHTSTVDEWTDNDQSAEYLNVNTGGTVLGNINMGQNAITNAQEVHIDGQAPLYLGSTVKTAGTAGVRITGTTNGEAAVVAPDSQSTFRPINVGEPTAQSHAVPKSTVDAALASVGDMKKADYDPEGAVSAAGGIAAFAGSKNNAFNFTSLALNSVNIDTVWNFNYIVSISVYDGTTGTVPMNTFGTVTNYFGIHFIRQTWAVCQNLQGGAVSGDAVIYERSRYAADAAAWSEWRRLATEGDLKQYLPLTGGSVTGILDLSGTPLSGVPSISTGQRHFITSRDTTTDLVWSVSEMESAEGVKKAWLALTLTEETASSGGVPAPVLVGDPIDEQSAVNVGTMNNLISYQLEDYATKSALSAALSGKADADSTVQSTVYRVSAGSTGLFLYNPDASVAATITGSTFLLTASPMSKANQSGQVGGAVLIQPWGPTKSTNLVAPTGWSITDIGTNSVTVKTTYNTFFRMTEV